MVWDTVLCLICGYGQTVWLLLFYIKSNASQCRCTSMCGMAEVDIVGCCRVPRASLRRREVWHACGRGRMSVNYFIATGLDCIGELLVLSTD